MRLVPLSEAREKALAYRKLARDGENPLEIRRKENLVVPVFKDAAQTAYEQHKPSWKNEKHASQWINTLSAYAFPLIGEIRVDQIDTPEVLRVLSPIWLAKPETARRVRQRIGTVLDWAKAAGFRSGDNPIDGIAKGLPRQPERKNHFDAIPYKDVPAFIRKLRSSDSNEITRLAFEFLILTATRTNEVLQARWDEVDLKKKTWTIPPSRMKAGREHRVPLAKRSIQILKRAKEITDGGDLVFPGRSKNTPLSNMVFLMTLRRMEDDFTAHGFRSAFRDWAAECTNYPREVCEMALAHSIKDKTEAAYRRGDLFEKRRELMAEWEEYALNGGKTK